MYALGVTMYRLMTKRYPHSLRLFNDEPGENYVGHPAMERIRRRLKDTPIDFDCHGLVGYPEAISFLRNLLDLDPGRRPSPEKALTHSCFETGEDLVRMQTTSDKATASEASTYSRSSVTTSEGSLDTNASMVSLHSHFSIGAIKVPSC